MTKKTSIDGARRIVNAIARALGGKIVHWENHHSGVVHVLDLANLGTKGLHTNFFVVTRGASSSNPGAELLSIIESFGSEFEESTGGICFHLALASQRQAHEPFHPIKFVGLAKPETERLLFSGIPKTELINIVLSQIPLAKLNPFSYTNEGTARHIYWKKG